jgi:cytochrome b561
LRTQGLKRGDLAHRGSRLPFTWAWPCRSESRMTQLANSEQRYGAMAMMLHWIMAVVLIMLIVLGLYMVSLPDVGFNTKKIALILYHKELGILALALAALRLAWRVGNALPRLVESLPDWQKVIARFVHLCFYALMFALPISGWIMSSATGIPVSFFGFFDLPDLVSYNDRLFHTFIDIHKWLGYALIVLILVHAGAALRHHLVLKDETLKRMWPGARS